MKLVFYILSLVFITTLPAGAVKKIEANPINVAAILVEKTDSADIAKTCEYYGYIRQYTDNNYTVYKHPNNGSIIRYTLNESAPNQTLATVEVKSKISGKEIDCILKDLNFKSIDNAYQRQSFGYTTKCSSGKQGYMVFSQQKKQKKQN